MARGVAGGTRTCRPRVPEARPGRERGPDARRRDGEADGDDDGRPPEWLTPLCHAAVAAEQVTLPGGLRARRLHLAREDGRRLALAVWLDAEGRPAAASLPGAWAAALLRGATGRPAGGAVLMAWTDATGAGPERLAREEARFARLAAALGVVADASDPP